MLNDVSKRAHGFAKASAPVRSGKLKRSIMWNRAKTDGYLQLQGILLANARHALWVHDGTQGPIRAKGGGGLRVPQNRKSARKGSELPNSAVLYKASVRGQKANPFLGRSITKSLVAERRVSSVGANRLQ